jgi:hypothetical protein
MNYWLNFNVNYVGILLTNGNQVKFLPNFVLSLVLSGSGKFELLPDQIKMYMSQLERNRLNFKFCFFN